MIFPNGRLADILAISMITFVKIYNPPYGADSKANYNYIAENIEKWIEIAISDRK